MGRVPAVLFVFLTTLHTTSTIVEVVLLFYDEVYFWAITKLVFVAGFFLFYRRDPPNESACCPLDPPGRIGLGPLAAFRPYCRCPCWDALRRRRLLRRRQKRKSRTSLKDEPSREFALEDTPTRRRRLKKDLDLHYSPNRRSDAWAEPSPSPSPFALGRGGLDDAKVPLLKTGPPASLRGSRPIAGSRSLPKNSPGRWCGPSGNGGLSQVLHPEDWCGRPASRSATKNGVLLTPPTKSGFKSTIVGSSGSGGEKSSGEKKRRKVTWDSSVDGGFNEDDEKAGSPRLSHASFRSNDGLSDSSEEDRSRRRLVLRAFDRKGTIMRSAKLYTMFYVVPQMTTNIARYQALVALSDASLWHGWDLGEDGKSGFFFWISSALCVMLFLGFYKSFWSAIQGTLANERLDLATFDNPDGDDAEGENDLDRLSAPVVFAEPPRKTNRGGLFRRKRI